MARKTWRYFETFVGAEDHALPPDNVQLVPELTVAHRTSPTNIGMALLATLAAHDFGFIDTDELADRIDATLTTVEGLERFEGHLLNWYDTRTLAPLPPAYVSTVDSGNLAGALVTLSVGAASGCTLDALAARGRRRCSTRMNFRFLYDPQRQLFTIGYRLADDEGPGRRDPSYYDLLASEARLASFLAIAKGDVPESHWFHLGRAVTSVRGAPVLLSWSATMFEYLMPLLRHAELSGHAARRIVPHGRAPPDGVRRGSRRALGHLGVRLQRRRSPRHLSVQGVRRSRARPEARAGRRAGGGALRHGARRDDRPAASAANLRRLAARGPRGRLRLLRRHRLHARASDDHDDARRRSGTPATGTVVRAYLAHHAGMTLVALANALLGDPMVKRFHADPRVQATELLLQERVPRHTPTIQPRPLDEMRVVAPPPAMPVRRYRSPHTACSARAVSVERQLRHGRHQRRRRQQLLPRPAR